MLFTKTHAIQVMSSIVLVSNRVVHDRICFIIGKILQYHVSLNSYHITEGSL